MSDFQSFLFQDYERFSRTDTVAAVALDFLNLAELRHVEIVEAKKASQDTDTVEIRGAAEALNGLRRAVMAHNREIAERLYSHATTPDKFPVLTDELPEMAYRTAIDTYTISGLKK